MTVLEHRDLWVALLLTTRCSRPFSHSDTSGHRLLSDAKRRKLGSLNTWYSEAEIPLVQHQVP